MRSCRFPPAKANLREFKAQQTRQEKSVNSERLFDKAWRGGRRWKDPAPWLLLLRETKDGRERCKCVLLDKNQSAVAAERSNCTSGPAAAFSCLSCMFSLAARAPTWQTPRKTYLGITPATLALINSSTRALFPPFSSFRISLFGRVSRRLRRSFALG